MATGRRAGAEAWAEAGGEAGSNIEGEGRTRTLERFPETSSTVAAWVVRGNGDGRPSFLSNASQSTCQISITWGPGLVSTRIAWGPGLVSVRITWGPGLVSMRVTWGPELVSVMVTQGPGLVGSFKVWHLHLLTN